jgi:hypothetical protein
MRLTPIKISKLDKYIPFLHNAINAIHVANPYKYRRYENGQPN